MALFIKTTEYSIKRIQNRYQPGILTIRRIQQEVRRCNMFSLWYFIILFSFQEDYQIKIMLSEYIMNNFDSRRVEFLIEHQINANEMKQCNKQQTAKLDNLLTECGIPQHTTLQYIYYLIYYLTI